MSIDIDPKRKNILFYNDNVLLQNVYGNIQYTSFDSLLRHEYFRVVNQVPSIYFNSFYQENQWRTENNNLTQPNCLKFMLDYDDMKSTEETFSLRSEKQNSSKCSVGYSRNKCPLGHDAPKMKSKIWRPFSPVPSSEKVELQQETVSCSRTAIFRIKPSNVKLGESKTSLFKAVKSRRSKVRSSGVDSAIKPFRCEHPSCFKSFSRNEELTRHKRIHSGVRPFLCTACGRRFGRRDHLRKHLQTHVRASERKVHLCSVLGCGHRYTRSDALARHKSTAHARKDPP